MRPLIFLLFLFASSACDFTEKNHFKIQDKVLSADVKFHSIQGKESKADPILFTFDLSAPKTSQLTKELKLYATQYYIYHAKDGGSIPLLDRHEKPLGYSLSLCDWCLGAIEGTIFLEDKNGKIVVLNNVGSSKRRQLKCTSCPELKNYKNTDVERTLWKVSDGFGDGINGFKLIPFRSIAVDEKRIPAGTVIYIPSVRGKRITLPNGKTAVHDGYFLAADKGSAIKNNHIDVFTGVTDKNPFPETIASDPNKTFPAYIIKDKKIIEKLTNLHLKK